MVCPSLESAMESLQCPPLTEKIESVFILGGTRVYEVSTCSNRRTMSRGRYRGVGAWGGGFQGVQTNPPFDSCWGGHILQSVTNAV